MINKAIFLDKDGVILDNSNWTPGYKEVILLPGVAEALRSLKAMGYMLIVVTNQSPVAYGYLTEEDVQSMHQEIITQLNAQGATLDAIYYCPHHPEEGCNCRKPATGMIDQAIADFDIEASNSWVIGDMRSDLYLAVNAHMKAILIRSSATDIDDAEAERLTEGRIAHDLLEAVHFVQSAEAGPADKLNM